MTKQLILPGACALANPLRGIVQVRADATNVNALLAQLNGAFEEFKKQNDADIAALKKNQGDVVRSEQITRIDASITDLNAKLVEAVAKMAAADAGAGGSGDPDKRAYKAAFNNYFRDGAGAEALGDLAVKAKLTTSSKPDGGYVVPDTMETTIDRILGKVSAVRGLSRVLNISTGTYKKLVNLGGAASGWVGEEQARPETGTPRLVELLFTVMELYANPFATQALLDDAIVDIESWLAAEVQTEFAEQEGAAFVTGDGVNRPKGFLSYSKVANSSYTWGSTGFIASGDANGFIAPTASAGPADALIDLLFALKQGYRNGATFMMNDTTMSRIRKFKDGDGNYIWAPPSSAEGVPTILGKPVVTDDNMPDIAANAFPIAVADWSRAYLVIDRAGIRVLRDPYTNKPNVGFYTTKRVGGGIQNFEAIKLLRISA